MFESFKNEYRKWELIDELAFHLRNYFQIKTPINNLEEIVNRIGGTIVEDDYKHMIVGIEKTSNTTFNLYVPICKKEENKRFYIAQQLGKFFLHTNYLADDNEYEKSDEFVFKTKRLDSVYEENFFGGAFLMPYEEFKEQIELNCDGGIVNTDKVAEHFKVTVGDASWRGKQLGLFKS